MQLETKYQKQINFSSDFNRSFHGNYKKYFPTHHNDFRDFVFRDFAK